MEIMCYFIPSPSGNILMLPDGFPENILAIKGGVKYTNSRWICIS